MNTYDMIDNIKKEIAGSNSNYDKFKLEPTNSIYILESICKYTKFNIDNTCLYNWIIKNVIEIYKKNNNNTELFDFIEEYLLGYIIKLKKDGPKYLIKLKFIIDKIINDSMIKDNITLSASYGNLYTFKFWEDYRPINNINSILLLSIKNCDDRVFDYLLKKSKINDTIILDIINTIDRLAEEDKYKLKKIKILSEHIDLSNYFDDMIQIMWSYNKILILKLFKFYYKKPLKIDSIKLVSMNNHYHKGDFYNKLNTINEKIYFELYNIHEDVNTIILHNLKTFEKIILKLDKKEIYYILSKNDLNYNRYNMIIQILIKHNLVIDILNLSDKYLISNKFIKLLLFTRFYVHSNGYDNVNLNLVLHKLRLWSKRFKKNKQIIHNANMLSILNELKTFEPNNKIPVLKNGSIKYQLFKQSFNNTKYITINNNINNCLVREEIKGIIVNSLPVDPYPNCEEINKYNIKADYIEDYDLYLVYDIDIPDTTVIERYEFLRSLHPYTNNTKLKTINNYNEYIKFIKEDNININHFINNNNELIKWYPKIAFFYSY